MIHTPGPWKYRKVGYLFAGTSTTGDTFEISGEDSQQWVAHSLLEANARLITAAPDLLSALKSVVVLSDRKHKAWDAAKSAIAKAEGR